MRQRFLRWLWIALAAAALSACGTNPVTKKKEFQFISEGQEIKIGQENYAPARQSQGGDFILDKELTEYVQSVGQRLAAVSDRQLPYEFVVLNDSVPNAWAMPGGKIAINRGLLYELNDESELAAVLGHEIVHAAARHGAKSMERGLLLQGAILAVGIGTGDSRYSQLYVQGAQIAAQLAATKYGRDAELESDKYGMKYMKAAGYDLNGAVKLQETFVRLSQGRKSNFLEGLFASHPPSEERVAENKKTAEQLGLGGEIGAEAYASKTAYIRKTKPAYDAYQEGMQALSKGDKGKAMTAALQALDLEPREARFHELLGDVELSQKRFDQALTHYNEAIQLQPEYFKPHVQTGIALFNLGKKNEAETALTRSIGLLPTAPGHYLLGLLAEERGDIKNALNNFGAAADSESEVGKQAAARYVRLDLPRNADKYLRSQVQQAPDGTLIALVQNASPVPISGIRLRVVRTDGQQIVGSSDPVTFTRTLPSGQVAQIPTVRVKLNDPREIQLFRVMIEAANVSQ